MLVRRVTQQFVIESPEYLYVDEQRLKGRAKPLPMTVNGPVREARYKYNPDGTRDGGVHALFVISGRKDDTGDASTCTITQENFWAQGQSNKLIARSLGLSPHTVKRHMARIFDKTGQSSRGRAGAWLLRDQAGS